MSKQKLLITTDSFLPRIDGVARFLMEMIPLLSEHFTITVVAPDFPGQKVQIKNQEEWKDKENTDTNTTQKKIYDLIKALDQGKGAPYEEVVSKAQHPDSPPEVEKIIELLLQKGYIFEITPGKLKVLD